MAKDTKPPADLVFKPLAQNFEVAEDPKYVYLRMEKGKDFGPSKSGKTIILASTEGNKRFETQDGKEIVFGLNIYKKNPNFKGEKE